MSAQSSDEVDIRRGHWILVILGVVAAVPMALSACLFAYQVGTSFYFHYFWIDLRQDLFGIGWLFLVGIFFFLLYYWILLLTRQQPLIRAMRLWKASAAYFASILCICAAWAIYLVWLSFHDEHLHDVGRWAINPINLLILPLIASLLPSCMLIASILLWHHPSCITRQCKP